ncbi:MAG: isochorismate synthase [Chloroflexia bacterium]|nr:isochorismate synthase [Chloroflexia bacterium]
MIASMHAAAPALFIPDPITDAVSMTRQRGKTTLVSCIEQLSLMPDPIAFLAASSASLGGGILWQQTQSGVVFSGAGSAFEMRADGSDRFGRVSATIRNIGAILCREDERVFPIIGGFAFGVREERSTVWRAFPDSRMVIPKVLLQVDDHRACIRITLAIEAGDTASDVNREMRALFADARRWADTSLPMSKGLLDFSRLSIPARTVWESTVSTAVTLIQQHMIDKVVLAREERLHAGHSVSPYLTLARMRSLDPETTVFAMQSDDDWFVGVTPERLVRLAHGRVDVTCLAGSTGIGQSDEQRAALAARLLASEKEREEHEIVVRSTMNALAEVCEDVTRLGGSPRVITARSVQHLETPIIGHLSSAGHVLDLVERLHPTPAVGGYPRDAALTVIRELEQIDRGWYAGPFGWTDLDGAGEFVVAIRSALLSGRMASLFAGCGIVADSNPGAEYEETRFKLSPMLAALGAA